MRLFWLKRKKSEKRRLHSDIAKFTLSIAHFEYK